MKNKRIVVPIVVALLIFLAVPTVSAVGGSWYGYAFQNVSETYTLVPDGTVIGACINDATSACTPIETQTMGTTPIRGYYYLDVTSSPGNLVSFKIGDYISNVTNYPWSTGPHPNVNIEVDCYKQTGISAPCLGTQNEIYFNTTLNTSTNTYQAVINGSDGLTFSDFLIDSGAPGASPLNGTINISEYTYNSSTTRAPPGVNPLNQTYGLSSADPEQNYAGKYLKIEIDPAVNANISWVRMKMYYTDQDLDINGDGDPYDIGDINEGSLKFWWHDNTSTGNWRPLDKDVNYSIYGGPAVFGTGVYTQNVTYRTNATNITYSGYVWVNLSHFSYYGIAGATLEEDITPPPPSPERGGYLGASPSGGGGGAPGRPTFLNKWENIIINETEVVNILEYTAAFGKRLYATDPRVAAVFSAKAEYVVSPQTGELLRQRGVQTITPPGEGVYEIAYNFLAMKYPVAQTIVVARGDVAADSLAATDFARQLSAPIILVEPDSIPELTKKILEKYRNSLLDIYIIGGPVAVSPGVEEELRTYCKNINCRTVERIWGETRYETSIELAKRIIEIQDTGSIMLTDGYNPVAFSGILAYIYKSPIIYLDKYSTKAVEDFLATRTFLTVGRLYYSG